jgi:long-chain acyl-CoA synthetase
MGTIWSGERSLSTEQLMGRAAQVATGFESLGIGKGDTVALYMRNDIAFFEANIGAGMLGAYPVAVNWHYTEDEARYLFEDSEAKALVIHADLLPPIRNAIPKGVRVLVVPTPPEVRAAYGIADQAGEVPEGMIDWNAWRESFEPREAPPAAAPLAIIYTSGTTGRPKGVRRPPFTPEQQEAVGRLLGRSYGFTDYMDDPSRITIAVVGPVYHSAPYAHSNMATRIGANVVIQPRFDAEDLLRLIETYKITHLNMVPIMFNRLLKLPEDVKRRYDLSSLRYVAHAAAPCPPATKRGMIEWWGPIIDEYYGATEMGNVTHCTSEEWLAHPGTVGKPVPEAEVKVIDEAGNALPPRAVGEVVGRIRAFGDFHYHRDEAKTRAALKADAVAPGDVGYFDEDGFLYLCDRVKDMIISGGVNIYPAEIEAELHKMPGVADCAVFGIPDEEYGEAICAVVQPQPGARLGEQDVRAFLRKTVAGYKVPKVITFSETLPREDSGKIFKRKLREPYWANAGRAI